MSIKISLREVIDDDLLVFFEQQWDARANHMAAFTREDPSDRDAFNAHWERIRADGATVIKTIVADGAVAGHIASFERAGMPEVTYWLGREFWGQGIATQALVTFLARQRARPLYARVAIDNTASIRVLEKCGFTILREERGFANARGKEIGEYLFVRE